MGLGFPNLDDDNLRILKEPKKIKSSNTARWKRRERKRGFYRFLSFSTYVVK